MGASFTFLRNQPLRVMSLICVVVRLRWSVVLPRCISRAQTNFREGSARNMYFPPFPVPAGRTIPLGGR